MPLAQRWDGGRWRLQATPIPVGATQTELSGIACPSVRECIAVGFYRTATHRKVPLAERWHGGRWQIQAVPFPGSAVGGTLTGVSCVTVRACVAVGYYGISRRPVPLTETWDETGWLPAGTPNPLGTGRLLAVSCTSADACTAVGTLSVFRMVAERWDGTGWRIQLTPVPAGAQTSMLSGVSCTAVNACTAVGSYARDAGAPLSLAEQWDGHRWLIRATASPAHSTLDGVSCVSARACVASGYYQTGNFRGLLAFTERWDGTRWQPLSVPVPAAAVASVLDGVSCVSANACTATGTYFASFGTHTMAVARGPAGG